MAFSEDLAARIRRQLGKRAGVVEKRIFGGLAFLVNGNMACGVHGQELIVRLDPLDTDRALQQKHTHIFDLSGRPMKGWILVRPAGLTRTDALAKWIKTGVTYAGSLPVK
jgi:TfoX-like protein